MINNTWEIYILYSFNMFCLLTLTVAFVVIVFHSKKEMREFFKILSTPKAPAPIPPPQYLPYEKCIPLFIKFITVCFQRSYITHIIPRITNAEGKITLLSPNDQVYSEFITSTVMQVFEGLPNYLQKSIFYYYNVISKEDPNDDGVFTLTLAITTQVTALLNQQIIRNAETVEMQGPTSEPVLKAINLMANMTASKKMVPRAPDGTEATIL
jgi:hypothetical protein